MSTFLRIGVGGEHYALDVAYVREVIEREEPTPLPGAGPHVLGILGVRGAVLPIVAFNRLVGAESAPWRRIAVVAEGDRRVGLAIETAAGVEEINAPAAGAAGLLVTEAGLHDERLVGVVDVPLLLDAVERSVP